MRKNFLRTPCCSIIAILLFFLISCNPGRNVTVSELQQHIKYLASDSLKGRLTGSEGDSLAARFIEKELASYGFKPLAGDGFQTFKVTTKLVPGPENDLSVGEKQFLADKDFMPLGFSASSGLVSEVVFAGYGFNIDLDSLKWNDYKGIDPKNKWVLILRADPETDRQQSVFIPYSSDRAKAITAKDMGAAGVLLVSGSAYDPQDSFESLNTNDYSIDIPVIRIKREVADFILAKSNRNIAELEKKLNSSRKPASFPVGDVVSAKAEVLREMHNTRNVAMVLPGEDEILKNEYLVFGAHFDHLGMGGKGSGSMVPDTFAVHYGADDNASGVGLMLELAEKFALTKGSHKRSIICIAFTGEEEGMYGSQYFVNNAPVDLTKVNAMINLDMVGRLQDSKIIQVSGIGTADGLRELFTSINDTNKLKLTLSDEGYGPSDHSSFYSKNIPVLFFTTGAHLDYHKPADTFEKINFKGMVTLSSLVFNVAEKLATSQERLKYKETGPRETEGRPMRRKGITLGLMPDVSGSVKNGMLVLAVTPGKPASQGGMKKGDIITAINGKPVNDIQEYMFRLGQLKRGETISVEVIRDKNKIVLLVRL